MLLNRTIEEELYNNYNPLKHLIFYGLVYPNSRDAICKNYGTKRVFLNKTILIADILTKEVADTLDRNWNLHEGDVVLLAFEFAKYNYKTQNAFLIKDQSDLQNIFSNINSAKTKRLKEVSMPYRNDTFLAGLHLVGAQRFREGIHNDKGIARLMEENIKNSREDGSFAFDLLEKKIYTFPFLEHITYENTYFIMKQRIKNSDINYIGII